MESKEQKAKREAEEGIEENKRDGGGIITREDKEGDKDIEAPKKQGSGRRKLIRSNAKENFDEWKVTAPRTKCR